jgi:hypothetical protein
LPSIGRRKALHNLMVRDGGEEMLNTHTYRTKIV